MTGPAIAVAGERARRLAERRFPDSVRMQLDRDPATDVWTLSVTLPPDAREELRSFSEAEITDRISSALGNLVVQICARWRT